MNKALEAARGGKLIGASLEATVYLYTSDSTLAARLKEACEPKYDADALHRIFITSQVHHRTRKISLILLILILVGSF